MQRLLQRETYRAVLAALLLAVPLQAWGAADFDLDLKELKRPVAPSPAKKHKAKTASKKKSVPKQAKNTSKPPAETAPLAAVAATPTGPGVAAADIAPAELDLTGTDACQLAERLTVALGRPVPAAELLHGLNLQPVAAVRYAGLEALVICGLSPAEAYTYGRLLAEHEVELIAISPQEQPATVARAITDALALSYQVEKDHTPEGGALVYLFPANQERQRPLRLSIRP